MNPHSTYIWKIYGKNNVTYKMAQKIQVKENKSPNIDKIEPKSMGNAKVPHKFLGPVGIEALNGFGVLYFVTGLLASAKSHA